MQTDSWVQEIQSAHIVGIGGIGTSGLARILKDRGIRVSGSDVVANVITHDLRAEGCTVHIGAQDGSALPDAVDVVIRTVAATPEANAEVALAVTRGVHMVTYPEALGELTRQYRTIAVTGTHGKTTTSAMIAKILIDAGYDPTVLVGAKLPFLQGSNARSGSGDWFVIEADEYRRAFDHYWPEMICLTNAEYDHPDAFSSEEELFQAYAEFLQHLPQDGLLVMNVDDRGSSIVAQQAKTNADTILTSVTGSSQAAVAADSIEATESSTRAMIGSTRLELSVPGEHNVANALQAIAVADHLDIDRATSTRALRSFSGAWRRFEQRGTIENAVVIDDYAHHPTEIRATLAAAQQRYPHKTIVAVFQAHHHDRLARLLDDFAQAFDDADEIMVLPTYHVAGRQTGIRDAHDELFQKLSDRYVHVRDVESLEAAAQHLQERISTQDDLAVIVMGAGDSTLVSDQLLAASSV